MLDVLPVVHFGQILEKYTHQLGNLGKIYEENKPNVLMGKSKINPINPNGQYRQLYEWHVFWMRSRSWTLYFEV